MFIKSETESFRKMHSFYESQIAEINRKLSGLKQHANIFAADYAQLENASMPIDFWAWECEAPENQTGWCIYDEDEDPCHDQCVFCGQPSERK